MTFFFRYELNGGGYGSWEDENISELLVPAEKIVTEFVIVASEVFWSLRKMEKTSYSGFKPLDVLVFQDCLNDSNRSIEIFFQKKLFIQVHEYCPGS